MQAVLIRGVKLKKISPIIYPPPIFVQHTTILTNNCFKQTTVDNNKQLFTIARQLFTTANNCLQQKTTIFNNKQLLTATNNCLQQQIIVYNSKQLFTTRNNCFQQQTSLFNNKQLFTATKNCLQQQIIVYNYKQMLTTKNKF